jgi:hypothetical protein
MAFPKLAWTESLAHFIAAKPSVQQDLHTSLEDCDKILHRCGDYNVLSLNH